MGPEVQIQPAEARLAAPRQSLTWILIALGLLTAGALSLVAGYPCFTDGFDSAGCITRQSDPSDLTGFTVLPSDLREAAFMLAASKLVIGLLWLSFVLIGARSRRSLAGGVVASIGGVCLVVAALPELWWFARGQVLLDNYEIVRFPYPPPHAVPGHHGKNGQTRIYVARPPTARPVAAPLS